MAKVKINWPPMSMKAEGEDAAVLAQAEQFLKYVKEAHKISFDVLPTIFRDGCRDPEEGVGEPECVGCNGDCESCETYEKANSVKPLTEPEEVAPGAQWDVVAIYDNAGIPSIMHRFRRMDDKDLFHGGKDKPHPAFIIGGEVYDEIYISVYENTMINGKPYSLPYMEPVTSITADKFADACFAKGEGWHCMTAAEWGLLACLSWKNGTLPHGNTNCGKYHADPTECGVNVKDSNKTLTGSGPATWTHDHTPTGVHDLCGNVLEVVRGLRIKDGALWAAENNDAALPETDLTTCGDGWKPIVDSNGDQVYVDAMAEYESVCKNALVKWYNSHNETKITLENVFVVWACKTLQNYKALLSTTVSGDGIYAEYTYNGDKQELYEDVYGKLTNQCIKTA